MIALVSALDALVIRRALTAAQIAGVRVFDNFESVAVIL